MAASILVVDDDPASRDGLVDVLRDEGYDVRAAQTAEEALEILETSEFELVVSDLRMPGMDGISRSAYPRPVAKQVAFQRWQAVLNAGYPDAHLLSAAKEYAVRCARQGRRRGSSSIRRLFWRRTVGRITCSRMPSVSPDPLDDALREMLFAIGVPKDSRDHVDYERGRKAIGSLELPSRRYEEAIQVLTEWVNV